MRKGLIAAVAAVLLSSPAFAFHCPQDMAAIDEAMKTAQLSDTDKAKVTELRTKGEEQHKAGDHAGSVKTLGEAKQILGIQ
ncbi:MAG: hypothetical protein AB7G34_07030 [Hyphomicrobiales bacterium]